MTSWVIAPDVTLPLPGWRNWSDAPDLKSGDFGHAGSSPAPGIAAVALCSVQPLLALAEQLERRDALVAERLAEIERLRAEVEEVRVHASAAAATELWLAERVAVTERELREAELAVPVLDDEPDEEAIAAHDRATRQVERLTEHLQAFARERIDLDARVELLERRAQASGLERVIAWASHTRGALLVEHSNLTRERENVVREASELLGSVLGDPLAATSVAGLRERLSSALP
jgi:chromosome segregation ATPase